MSRITPMNIILGVSGGIAAYKTPEIVRLLRAGGAEVRVVMTEAARAFITPLTLHAISGHPVIDTHLDAASEAAMDHIELARWADAICIAPASAHLIAKLRAGLADDSLTTVCCASRAPLWLAPAMNQQMWQASSTQENCRILQTRGVVLIGPGVGEQACGDVGPGRMSEPSEISQLLLGSQHTAADYPRARVVITAGATREALDPVRFISNHSSGKMGFALAEAARQAGQDVVLITGCCQDALMCHPAISRIDVTNALEMDAAVQAALPKTDIFIGAAAVADYRASAKAAQKIKKSSATLTLELIKNPDIIARVAQAGGIFTVGFAAETENLMDNATRKRKAKRLDMIIANRVADGETPEGFCSDDNTVVVLSDEGAIPLPTQAKTVLAQPLIELILRGYAKTLGGSGYCFETANENANNEGNTA